MNVPTFLHGLPDWVLLPPKTHFLVLEHKPNNRMHVNVLTEKELKKLVSPTHLSPLQQDVLSMHHKLFHLPYLTMLRLGKFGVLLCRFLKLRNDLPPCVSCVFGKAHRIPWHSKSSATKHDRTMHDTRAMALGERVYTDQLVSAQPRLVPQEKVCQQEQGFGVPLFLLTVQLTLLKFI